MILQYTLKTTQYIEMHFAKYFQQRSSNIQTQYVFFFIAVPKFENEYLKKLPTSFNV